MIVSASRRTDIPAYHGDWFLRCVREGFVWMPDPVDPRRSERVALDRKAVDAFVFWTKNAAPFFPVLDELDRMGYPYFIQYTLNDYPISIEPRLPPVEERIRTMLALSARIGPDRLMWRYDPVLFTDALTPDAHLRHFERLCARLASAVAGCSFKFLDTDAIPSDVVAELGIRTPDPEEQRRFVAALAAVAHKFGIPLEGCCDVDYSEFGVAPMVCVDRARMEKISGHRIPARKDDCAQNPACTSLKTRDIGSYATCRGGCAYCYAGGDALLAEGAPDPTAPSLAIAPTQPPGS